VKLPVGIISSFFNLIAGNGMLIYFAGKDRFVQRRESGCLPAQQASVMLMIRKVEVSEIYFELLPTVIQYGLL